MLSVRRTISGRWPDVDLSLGILRGLSHPFYQSRRRRFPYPSLTRLLSSLDWPQEVEPLDDHPHDSSPGWSDNVQGVAHDDHRWFITQEDRLRAFPLEHDLARDIREDHPGAGVSRVGIPSSLREMGYDHFGDLDYFEGHLYVPIEHSEKELPGRVVLFDAQSLRAVSSGPGCLVSASDGD